MDKNRKLRITKRQFKKRRKSHFVGRHEKCGFGNAADDGIRVGAIDVAEIDRREQGGDILRKALKQAFRGGVPGLQLQLYKLLR